MNINIRNLMPEEIEIRAQMVKEKGFVALLYKDARCDMKILDETFGITGWQREHTVVNGNLFCTVSIWDSEKQQWIKKQDVGTESFTEKEKGQASDSFKRACTNIGIGRELYTTPFIWINCNKDEIKSKNGKFYVDNSLDLRVSKMEVLNNKITSLEIKDQTDKVRYFWSEKLKSQKQTEPKEQVKPQQNNYQQQGNPPSEKEVLKAKIVSILTEKNIDFSRMSDYLLKNYQAKTLMELNINQMKVLAHNVEFEWK